MAERKVLMTLDEARGAFASSAFGLATSLTCAKTRMMKLLAGEGRTTGLSPAHRAAVLEHKRLTNALRADGLEHIVESELEGLASYLEAEVAEEAAAG